MEYRHFVMPLLLMCIFGLSIQTAQSAAEEPPKRITVAVVGDILIHQALLDAAYNMKAKTYDFGPLFAPITPYLRFPDYTLGNLETVFAGEKAGYGGYPRFNAPASLAPVLKQVGFDLLGTANNHCMDKGWAGLTATLDCLDASGLSHTGTNRTATEQAAPRIVDVQGIKLGILCYTDIPPETPVPADKPFTVNRFNTKKVIAAAAKARQQGAELVIAVLHMGAEYRRAPDDGQRRLAEQLLSGGVDVIIGSHPHVVQPIERITIQRNGRPFTGLVAWSLGNFVSSQRERYRDYGLILYLHIERDDAGTRINGVGYLPVWVQRYDLDTYSLFRALPVLPDIPHASDLPLSQADLRRMDQVWEEMAALAKPEDGIVPFDIKVMEPPAHVDQNP